MIKTIKGISHDIKPLSILFTIIASITYLHTEYRVLGFRGVLILFLVYLLKGTLEENGEPKKRAVLSTICVIVIILSHYLYY